MEVFVEISVILAITLVISGVIRMLKQPPIIGYIIAGIVVSPYFLNLANSVETIEVFSQIGITMLLFIVGLNLSPKVIKEVGKVSLVTGIGQIVFTSAIGFVIARILGFANLTAFYIAIALTFSSTIIIMKLLSDKKDLEKLYGKISIGFLLVQDLFVIVLLMIISSLSGDLSLSSMSLANILIGIGVMGGFILVSKYVLPSLSKFFAKSQEFLFLFSIGWGMGLAALFHYLGLSIEVGALVAGISLSVSPFNYEISSKLKPLRDFFIILFFISLGSQMTFGNIGDLMLPAIIFSLFILIGNPLIVMILMGSMGYKKRTGFEAGFTVAQISEFSLILIALGVSIGHVSPEILSLVTIVGLVTISASTYLILYSGKLYKHFSKYLSIFEKKGAKRQEKKYKSYDMILFGYNRIGSDLLKSFKNMKRKYLVVDYNPDTISRLSKNKIRCMYGDADDEEFLEEMDFSQVKMVVSTIPDFETSLLLIGKIREQNKDTIIITTSHDIDEAKILYDKGASYVIMPHFLGGSHASKMIEKHQFDFKEFMKERDDHIKYLDDKKKMGHNHPGN